jgi:AraC-like DNA-binding protein
MLFRSYTPAEPLRPFAEDFWLYENYSGVHARERILPSGTVELVFNLREDEIRIYGPGEWQSCRRFSGAVISGPYAGAFMSDAEEETAIMGVHLKPGGVFPLLGLPAGPLTNRHVNLEDAWGPAGRRLYAQLRDLKTADARFHLLEATLLTRLRDIPRRNVPVRLAVDLMVRAHGSMRVRDVALATDVSQRHLIQTFTETVGLRPKTFGRILRFQRAIALAQGSSKIEWAQLATGCGYADQSHLISEFAEFAGVTPADYRLRQTELDQSAAHQKRNHLPFAA